ncbi:hypothetical protein AJ87_46840 [Rhizobium yanglingense]|nr:hypothetical protein AJ87_46840 [Rhizobium yanglingense]
MKHRLIGGAATADRNLLSPSPQIPAVAFFASKPSARARDDHAAQSPWHGVVAASLDCASQTAMAANFESRPVKRRAMNCGASAKPQLLCNGANPSGAAVDLFR